ncbi:response regulator transcription factor [Pseudomonas sp. SA3-5]|uniref:Response regulator transcription factor n=1 Tax=Pseudomonas aestuarii TaxID=3018340 RepID=A0ABT4XC77_9PSED|nr:response regulator transcription factor [Pseudomonas aestuarii]MDA7085793.1 response regulator transcription factor [Pseudomonas aestuarii]
MLHVTHKEFLPTNCYMAHMNTHALTAPRLLWFDLTHDESAPDCMAAFASMCQISLARDLSVAGINTQQRPDMICMHYDRPDTMSLNLLIEVKRAVPSIPITMLTMHHSEELAVWAFRSGVWDYLALPLVQAERNRYLSALRELCSLRRNAEMPIQKKLLTRSNDLPESVRLTADHQKQRPLQDAIQYIELHFKEHIEQKELAKRCGMTPFRFSRLFKQTYGVGFLEFIQSKRMEKAEELLNNSEMPITSIAYAVGFQDPSYFARTFKQHFGCCPSDFRSIEPSPEPANVPLRLPSSSRTEEMC